jgi:hypothetical protein
MHGVDKWVEVRAAYAAGKKIKQIVKELEVSRGFARSVIRAETCLRRERIGQKAQRVLKQE